MRSSLGLSENLGEATEVSHSGDPTPCIFLPRVGREHGVECIENEGRIDVITTDSQGGARLKTDWNEVAGVAESDWEPGGLTASKLTGR